MFAFQLQQVQGREYAFPCLRHVFIHVIKSSEEEWVKAFYTLKAWLLGVDLLILFQY